jgi:preprotein translocase subunit YajC
LIPFLTQIAATTSQPSNPVASFLLPLVLIGGVFYFIMVRPQQRRVKEQRALLGALEIDDEVMTSGGIFGTIVDIDDDEDVVTVEIAPGTNIRILRAGISRRVTADGDDEGDSDEDDDEEEDDDEGVDAES